MIEHHCDIYCSSTYSNRNRIEIFEYVHMDKKFQLKRTLQNCNIKLEQVPSMLQGLSFGSGYVGWSTQINFK